MDPSDLLQSLRKKLKLLREMLSVSEAMNTGLHPFQMGRVTDGLTKRQELMSRIDQMDKDMKYLQGDPPWSTLNWPVGWKDEIRLCCQSIEEVLHQMKTMDDECYKQISVLRDDVKTEIQLALQGMLTVRGYQGKSANTPKCLDVER